MTSIFTGIDMSDPCAVWPKLQEALDRLLAGERTSEIEMRTQVSSVRKEFAQTDRMALQQRIRILKLECARKTTGRPSRRAITFG